MIVKVSYFEVGEYFHDYAKWPKYVGEWLDQVYGDMRRYYTFSSAKLMR